MREETESFVYQISSDEEGVPQDSHKKLVYRHETGKLELPANVLDCLSDKAYLKDSVIQFYLTYLVNEECSEDTRKRIHIFDPFFHNRIEKLFNIPKNSKNIGVDINKLQQLDKWFENVDIFEKDFLIFPVCHDVHWYAIVACYPYRVTSLSHLLTSIRAKSNGSGGANHEIINKPLIIVLDSLGQRKSTWSLKVRDFLDFSWRLRSNEWKQFSHHNLPECFPSLPLQENSYDCGIYMLSYIRAFIENLDDFYELAQKPRPDKETKVRLKSLMKKGNSKVTRDNLKELINKICKDSTKYSSKVAN